MLEISDSLTLGLPLVMNISVLILAVSGSLLGILIGAIPGLTGTMAVAILIPLTYSMNPQQAFALLLSTYAAACYGGSISAILLNMPGTSAAIMTTLDGYPMCKRGEAGKAIGICCIFSFVGGALSALFLAFFSPILARWALKLGTHEYFAVAIFGLAVISYISSGLFKGLIAATFGLWLSTIGTDSLSSFPRYIFGKPELMGGLSFISVMIGLFGIGEILSSIDKGLSEGKYTSTKITGIIPKLSFLLTQIPTAIRSVIIGLFIGLLPAAGPTIASVVSYGMEKRIGRKRNIMGTGVPEGLVAAETANNAATGAAIVPLITLGIPGDAVTAILLGALLLHGLRPGPALFIEKPDVVSSIFILFLLANFLFLIFGLLGARLFVLALRIPQNILFPTVVAFCFIGSYAVNNSIFDIIILIIFGFIGYIMKKLDISPAPLVLGFILGPIVESNLRRALILSDGDILSFFRHPISGVIMILTILLLFSPIILRVNDSNSKRKIMGSK